MLTGHCLCGAVRLEIDRPLVRALYCHCTRCQRRTGTGSSVSAVVERGSLRITAGEELLKAWVPEQGFAKVFCAGCGGHVLSHSQDDPEDMSVRMGALDGDPGVRPSLRQWVSAAAVWEPLPDDGLPRFPESSRGLV